MKIRLLSHLACSLMFLGFSSSLAGSQPAASFTSKQLLESIQSPDGPAGFCVHLNCGDGALTLELARNPRLSVHALDPAADNVERTRQRLQARQLYGMAAVEQWNEPFLPYADNVVNVLIAEPPASLPQAELLRVVTPGGVLWMRTDNAWQAISKPWPSQFDEWTHWRHGADGNMVSQDAAVKTPVGLRWIAGPPQDPGGRKWYYDHVLVSSAGRNFYTYENTIVARDAFNGRLLWTREGRIPAFREEARWGSLLLGKRTSKVRPVASSNRLYAALDAKLVEINAENGQTIHEFCELTEPREILLASKTLLVSSAKGIQAFDPESSLRWEHEESPRRMVASSEALFYVSGSNVVCLDIDSGKELWRITHPKAADTATCSYYQGVLVLERSSWKDEPEGNGILALSGQTGQELWTYDFAPGMTHFKESRAFFADGLVWLQRFTEEDRPKVKFTGFDPRSGQVKREWNSRGLHCAAPIATEQYLIAPELEFTDLQTGAQTRARMVKSACRLPFVPANGLLYTFPVQCECFPMLRGYMGLSSTPHPAAQSAVQLTRGPAFEPDLPGTTNSPTAEEWPMYRRDVFRSGSSMKSLPTGPLQILWDQTLESSDKDPRCADWQDDPFSRDAITAPVCAGQTLLVAVPHRHQIVALNPVNGDRRWTFTAGGRVDTPPTIAGPVCVFGAHDGQVYCLRLSDGELLWRFHAAPIQARIPVYGQMESPWPVAGGVLVEKGVAYFAAGRHPMADGGLRVYALRISDGQVLWTKPITETGVQGYYGAKLPETKIKVGVDYEPVDLLVRDGPFVAMSRWQFNPISGEMRLAFTETNYAAFTQQQVPRGLWGYGIRQTKPVLTKPATVFNAESIHHGQAQDAALLLAGEDLARVMTTGELVVGDRICALPAPAVHDGIITAYGRLYVACRNGIIYCVAAK